MNLDVMPLSCMERTFARFGSAQPSPAQQGCWARAGLVAQPAATHPVPAPANPPAGIALLWAV